MRKIFAIFLLMLGASIFLVPYLDRLYSTYQEDKLMADWEKAGVSSETAKQNYKEMNKIFKSSSVEAAGINNNNYSKSNPVYDRTAPDGMLGILKIPKIDLRVPILEGASLKNMKIAAGHITGTSFPGEPGNIAIAAHRSRTYGRMFNRLNEIQTGDQLILEDKHHTYKYQVYKKMVVKPSNTSILNGTRSEKTLTLITCTPIDTATHRLIIKAKLVQ
ncbi:MAG: class D sortase [Bacillota bacterium]|nr:class D sortase [Bacillota bacterium]